MEPKKVGRTLGIGVRVASNMLRERVERAAAAHPPPAQAGNGRPAAAAPAIPIANRVAGVKRGAKAFGQAFLGPFTHAGSVLWLEITGLFFALFAVFFAQSVYRAARRLEAGAGTYPLVALLRPDRSLRLVLGELVSSRLPQEQAGPRGAKIDQKAGPDRDLGLPGEYPFTRGIRSTMYRGRLWGMRQYSGMGDAEQSNQRYKFLLAQGGDGLSVAFDLPTQIGYDSDSHWAAGEVGRAGVAIDSIEDMERLFAGIPLEEVSTSMTINATATILLALYVTAARRSGCETARLTGTVQNDILKEYIARGTYLYPLRHSLRLVGDLFAWAGQISARVESHLRLRLPHARGGGDCGAGSRLYPGQRPRLS